jgi:AhpD family alkylhydroperoxidase
MLASRQEDRVRRAAELPIVGGLPDYPGILAAMMISPEIAESLRTLADALLAKPHHGTTLNRSDRELIAAAVSAGNDCFYCMDTHAAFAAALLQEQGMSEGTSEAMANDVKCGRHDLLTAKLQELIGIALSVREHGRNLQQDSVQRAIDAGATNEDVQLAIFIASAFCMYNRIVDGFRTRTPVDVNAHKPRANSIVRFGYNDPRLTAIPALARSSIASSASD